MGAETQAIPPGERVKQNTGECNIATKSCDCKAFVYASNADGFRTCACGHTQWSHKLP